MATASTSRVSGASEGSGISSRRALSAVPGNVVMARIAAGLLQRSEGLALAIRRSLNNAMMIVRARSLRLVGGALALASLVGVAGCRRLAERLNQHETVPGTANEPSSPPSPPSQGA